MTKTIEFSIKEGDIRSFDADVVALAYAQGFYGPNGAIARTLSESGISYDDMTPQIGDNFYLETHQSIHAPHVLFVGVPHLLKFGYQKIREFSVTVLNFLAQKAPTTRHLAMTIHGPGYGLDEVESLLSQFAGYLQVIWNGRVPSELKYISIVEINSNRVKRLRYGFEKNVSGMENVSKIGNRWAYRLEVPKKSKNRLKKYLRGTTSIESAGAKSVEKPHVFVAMPFRKDMEDIFYYGIQRAVHANDLLCERVDQEAFTGDILERVKKKIETATVVIAELSGANPNVYLEVGYAWGKNIPTILLVKKNDELRFDVRGQRCLKYEIIKELEEALTKELTGLLGK